MVRSLATSFARLHIVTNEDIVARPSFVSHATSILDACGARVAVHIRMKRATARSMCDIATEIAAVAAMTGSMMIINERLDVALACGADGVHLGSHSIPVAAARAKADDLLVGYSAHSVGEAVAASADGADYVVMGTIWASGSHPGECGAGVERIAAAASVVASPLLAIGGVTPSRSQEALLAGAHGVAVITGVWDAADPAEAALNYLEAMRAVT